MAQKTTTILLRGGLDLSTPAIAVQAGRCIAGLNYEPEVRGYSRAAGYERYDGRPKPSEADYYVLGVDDNVVAVSAGDVVTGGTSGATGISLIDGVAQFGSFPAGNSAGYMILYNVVGTFQDGEDLEVSASPVTTADGTAVINGAGTDEDDETWSQLAIEARRTAIQKPAGSGPIRGVFRLKGEDYCIRDNAGATAAVLFKASASGWVAQSFGAVVAFTSGTAQFEEGGTLTGGTSGATATIERVITRSGNWGSTAAGFLVLSGITGTFQAAETITASPGSATCSGAQTALTLPPGGRYEFLIHNFYGASNLSRVYGVNGVGRAFEWDGSVLAFCYTGLSDALDKPTHIAVRSNHLLLSFRGGGVLNSSIGEPLDWRVDTGAGEFNLGEDVTGMVDAASTSTVIFGRGRISYLVGDDTDTFELKPLASDAGAREWTVQKVVVPLYVDDAGIRRLDATDAFGDFRMGAVSEDIETFFRLRKETGRAPTASVRVRARDQYRAFYDDGYVVTTYMGRKRPEIMLLLWPHVVNCTFQTEDENGSEFILFGTADGWVCEMMAGTSYDGAEIAAFVRFPFNNLGQPTLNKRWHKVTLEFDGATDTEIGVVADFSYGDPDLPASGETLARVAGTGGFWGVANWDEFYWSQPVQGKVEAYIDGFGNNMSVTILSDATYEAPHTLSALTINFSERGMIR